MDKSLEIFVEKLQELQEILGTERLGRILDWSIGTFSKQYDKEEEKMVLMDDMLKYINNEFTSIDNIENEREKHQEKITERLLQYEQIKLNLNKVLEILKK